MKKPKKDKVDEAAERLMRIVEHPDIISGIHNYCDRWCERCTHTKHCTVYKMEFGETEHGKEREMENEEFWEDLSTMFQVAAKLLHEQMEEMGINPEDIKDDEPLKLEPDPKSSLPVKTSKEYTMNVSDWLKQNRDKVAKKFETLASINENKANCIVDAFEVIQYYFMMVSTKTYRAMIPRDPEHDTDDGRGSAKVALILIDRSTASWVRLLDYFPEFEDDILGFLKLLAQVKKLILETFPNAMDFVRPGFDE